MGKIHRIKRSFQKVFEHNPWQTLSPGESKRYPLAGGYIGLVAIYVGRRYNGSHYISYYRESYKGLMRKLIRDYEDGVAHSDKTSVKK